MADYLDKLAARGIVSPSRMDILRQGLDRLKESLVPDYLRDTPSSPQADRALADPNGKPRKIGPPSGPPTTLEKMGGLAGDVAGGLAPELKGAAAIKGALTLLPIRGDASSLIREFSILNDAGEGVGNLTTRHLGPKKVRVEWIGGKDPSNQLATVNSFGPADMRNLIPELKQFYPEMESLVGERLSGANPNRYVNVKIGASE